MGTYSEYSNIMYFRQLRMETSGEKGEQRWKINANCFKYKVQCKESAYNHADHANHDLKPGVHLMWPIDFYD